MNERYATPAAFKAALEQRLRDRAAEHGEELQRLRQMVVYERFLARVFRALPHAVVLKGGLLLELRLARARATKDIDLRMTGGPDEALARLQAAGRLDLEDYLRFELVPDPQHPTIEAAGMRYEGHRFRAEARLAGKVYGRPFGVDVAFAEPLVGTPEPISGGDHLAFAGLAPVIVSALPLETHIAEKLHAYTLPRPRPNSRVKDLPDLALLSTARDIEAAVLREALTLTWQHRATHPLPARLPQPPEAWAAVYAQMAVRDRLPWPGLVAVTRAARELIDPILGGARGSWIASARLWR